MEFGKLITSSFANIKKEDTGSSEANEIAKIFISIQEKYEEPPLRRKLWVVSNYSIASKPHAFLAC
jgi:hypothetical protein